MIITSGGCASEKDFELEAIQNGGNADKKNTDPTCIPNIKKLSVGMRTLFFGYCR